jgi:hypothetical protein
MRHHPGFSQIPGLYPATGLGDFTSDLAGSPSFQQGWSSLQNQITYETQQQGMSSAALSDKLNAAQSLYENSYQSLLTQGFNAGSLADGDPIAGATSAASQLVAAGSTVLGAVNTVQGLVNAAEHGTPTQIVQAFTGTLVTLEGIAVSAGLIAPGVGAAIVAGITIVAGLLEQVLGGTAVPTTMIGQCQVPNTDLPSWTVGATYPEKSSSQQPLPAGPIDTRWRKFPVTSKAADAWWFAPYTGPSTSSYTLTIDTLPLSNVPGAWSITWTSGSSTDTWYNCGGVGTRPIDAAFAAYYQLECDITFANQTLALQESGIGEVAWTIAQFTKAFFAAWAANNEYAMNGYNAVSDEKVLAHVITHWNAAHAPGIGYTLSPPSASSSGANAIHSGSCSPAASYVHLLAGSLTNQGTLQINTGALYVVQNVGNLKSDIVTPTTSTTKKVAVGAAVAAGGLLTAAAIHSYITSTAFSYVLGKGWDAAKGFVKRHT